MEDVVSCTSVVVFSENSFIASIQDEGEIQDVPSRWADYPESTIAEIVLNEHIYCPGKKEEGRDDVWDKEA